MVMVNPLRIYSRRQLGFGIGNTSLKDIPQLSGRYHFNVAVKDESENEASGTFKDRSNLAVLEEDRNVDTPIWYVQITSGNSGISLGRLCQAYEKSNGKQRRTLHLVGNDTPDVIKNALAAYGMVHTVNLRDGPIPNNTRDTMARHIVGDETAEYKVVERVGLPDGYGGLAEELYRADARYWFVPVGEGELMTKLALAVHDSPRRPKIVGVTINDNVFASRKIFKRRVGRSPADKLVTPYSDFKSMLDEICRTDGHEIIVVSDRQLMKEFEYLRNEIHMRVEPSAAAPFAGSMQYAKRNGLTMHDKGVIVNTGEGIFARHSPDIRRYFGFVAAGLLTAVLGNYAVQEGRSISREYENVRRQEAIDIDTLTSQREYLVVSTTDPIEAFAWYRAEIAPLEGGGSFLSPKARKFVLVPDHGKSGLVRMYNSRDLDNIMRRVTSDAYVEFNEFLKVREGLMKTSLYSKKK